MFSSSKKSRRCFRFWARSCTPDRETGALLDLLSLGAFRSIFAHFISVIVMLFRAVISCLLILLPMRLSTLRIPMRMSSSVRLPAGSASLDTAYLCENWAVVESHLQSRKVRDNLLQDASKLPEMRSKRNSLIVQKDSALNTRKTLSQQIGLLMKEGKTNEVEALKKQVEEASNEASASEEQLAIVDEEINAIFRIIPNLLDDR